jgi:hypothetical protein
VTPNEGRVGPRNSSTSSMLVNLYETANIPEDSRLHTHRRENLKLRNVQVLFRMNHLKIDTFRFMLSVTYKFYWTDIPPPPTPNLLKTHITFSEMKCAIGQTGEYHLPVMRLFYAFRTMNI